MGIDTLHLRDRSYPFEEIANGESRYPAKSPKTLFGMVHLTRDNARKRFRSHHLQDYAVFYFPRQGSLITAQMCLNRTSLTGPPTKKWGSRYYVWACKENRCPTVVPCVDMTHEDLENLDCPNHPKEQVLTCIDVMSEVYAKALEIKDFPVKDISPTGKYTYQYLESLDKEVALKCQYLYLYVNYCFVWEL